MEYSSSNLVDLARQLIAIDTTTTHGTAAAARWLAEVASAWGLQSEVVDETWNGIANANLLVCAKNQTPADAKYILSASLDTADPGEYAMWTKTGANPFNASVNGDSLFGLGAASGKVDVLCKLIALQEASRKTNPQALVLGTFGRESGTGAIRLIRQKKIKPRAALVSSPTGLCLARRAPGYAKVEITIDLTADERGYIEQQSISEGTTSQSKIFSNNSRSRAIDFGLHDNPIMRMIDYLKNLPSGMAILSIDGGTSAETQPDVVELEVQIVDHFQDGLMSKLISIGELIKQFAIELKTVEAKDFSPAHSTVNVGQIRMLPEQVKMSGICRLVPISGRDIYEKWLEKMRIDCAAAGGQFQILDFKPPFASLHDEPFFELTKGVSSLLSLDLVGATALQCTEANVFHRLGIETVVFGPGVGHGSDPISLEHVKISELEKAVEFYRSILQTQEVLG